MDNLRYFKLVNGDAVLAVQEAFIIGQGYRVRSPMAIFIIPNDEGNAKVFLNRWVPFSDDQMYVISDRQIITTSSVDAEMTKYYMIAIETEKRYLEMQVQNAVAGELDVEWTPDEKADYKEEMYESGEEGKVTPHPLMKKINKKKDKPN